MSPTTVRDETTTYHDNVEGQANPQFAHRNDWAEHCPWCTESCSECGGVGADHDSEGWHTCPICWGTGRVEVTLQTKP